MTNYLKLSFTALLFGFGMIIEPSLPLAFFTRALTDNQAPTEFIKVVQAGDHQSDDRHSVNDRDDADHDVRRNDDGRGSSDRRDDDNDRDGGDRRDEDDKDRDGGDQSDDDDRGDSNSDDLTITSKGAAKSQNKSKVLQY